MAVADEINTTIAKHSGNDFNMTASLNSGCRRTGIA
jgi:hypothetical protein